MRTTLFEIKFEVGGVPLFGEGILLALWLIAAAIFLVVIIRRQGLNQETLSYLPAVVLVAAVLYFLPRLFVGMGGVPIRGYGLMVLLGASTGIALAAARSRRVGVDPDTLVSLCFWMIVAGIVGARVFYVIQNWGDFRTNSLVATIANVINITRGGLVIYGSIIGGAITFFVYTLSHHLPILKLGDLIAPGLAAGICLGRIGCFLNGCCFGGGCDAAWAVSFPADSPPYNSQVAREQTAGFVVGINDAGQAEIQLVAENSAAAAAGLRPRMVISSVNGAATPTQASFINAMQLAAENQVPTELVTSGGQIVELPHPPRPPRSQPVHPTQLYSSIHAALLCGMLWYFYPLRRRDGQVFALFMITYSIGRFLLEFIRKDEGPAFGTELTISQNISVLVLVGGVLMAWWLMSRPPRQRAAGVARP